MAISVKAAAILAIIIESILYGQYICTAFILYTFELINKESPPSCSESHCGP